MEILSPAKINLFLHITGRRPDGYHELKSLMCRVSLYDRIHLRFGRRGIRIQCAHPNVPLDESNLAYRAAQAFFSHCGLKSGITIGIEKKIPVAAGLGGGSSNAASVLIALNDYFGEPMTRGDLLELGGAIGADVPFFIFQTPALATGIGDVLEAIERIIPYQIVIVYTGVSVSTREVYQKLNLALTNCKKKPTKPFLKNRTFNAAQHLCNDLETVTVGAFPEIADVKERLKDEGALGALMSGSGPSVFGLFADSHSAGRAMKILRSRTAWQIFRSEMLLGPVRLLRPQTTASG